MSNNPFNLRPKFFDDPRITLPRLNEDLWFAMHQQLLLSIANTKFGRDLLCIPQEYPVLEQIRKNMVQWENADGTKTADFRIGSKWANVIRCRWDQFNSYARYFQSPRVIFSTEEVESAQMLSPLVRVAMSMTATTLTAYPDPNPETTTVDGGVWRSGVNETYSTIRTSAGNGKQDSDVAGEAVYLQSTTTSNQYSQQNRGVYEFDTSAITSVGSISDGVLSFVADGKNDAFTQSVCVDFTATASPTALANGDYNIANWAGVDQSSRITISSWVIDSATYNDFTLNSTGRGNVNKTGVTVFGLRLSCDMDNSAPTWGSNVNSYARTIFADTGGTTKDPKLVITYSIIPTAPSGLAAAAVSGSPGSMALTWTDNSSNEDHFELERSPDGSSGWTLVQSPAANEVSVTDTGLTGDTTYYYRIRAVHSSGGASSYSSTASAQTAPKTPTGAAVAAANGSTSLTITWTDAASSETAYEVERSDTGAGGWSNISGSLAAGATQYVDAVGANSSTKYYRVRAMRSSTASGYSSTVSATTAPAAPSGVAVAAVTGGFNLTITWTDNSSDESTFRIERSNDGATGWSEIGNVSAGTVTYSDTTVGAGDTTRHYRVRALRAGDSIYSNYAASASGVTSPATPTSLAGTVSNLNTTLTWGDASSTNTSYKLERKLGSGSYSTVTTSITANAVTYTDTEDLVVGSTYTYRLSAYRSTDGVYSPTTTVAVIIPPEEPSELLAACTVAAAAASKVQLVWNINSVEETGFLIERSLTGVGSWSTVTTTAAGVRTYEDSGLEIDTTYYYRVTAVGSAANSSPCTVASIVTTLGKTAQLLYAFQKKAGFYPN